MNMNMNMDPEEPTCSMCKHRRWIASGCDAYPKGVPEEMYDGLTRHDTKRPDQDNDIVFEEGFPLEYDKYPKHKEIAMKVWEEMQREKKNKQL